MQTLLLALRREKKLSLAGILLLSMAFSVSLLGFRIYYAQHYGYLFLIWNLFLAAIPYAISTTLCIFPSWQNRWGLFAPLVFLWLLFFPNAPYLITDLFHLAPKYNIPLWYDLLLIMSFVWNGMILAYLSLYDIERMIRKKLGADWAWTTVLGALGLSAFGIYLGRYLRWNSWDLFTQPGALLTDILDRIADPFHHLQTWGMTLGFAGFLIVGYLLFRHITRLEA